MPTKVASKNKADFKVGDVLAGMSITDRFNEVVAPALPLLAYREQAVYQHLHCILFSETGTVWYSKKMLAEQLGKDERSVAKALATLVDIGLISREQEGKHGVVTSMLMPPAELDYQPDRHYSSEQERDPTGKFRDGSNGTPKSRGGCNGIPSSRIQGVPLDASRGGSNGTHYQESIQESRKKGKKEVDTKQLSTSSRTGGIKRANRSSAGGINQDSSSIPINGSPASISLASISKTKTKKTTTTPVNGDQTRHRANQTDTASLDPHDPALSFKPTMRQEFTLRSFRSLVDGYVEPEPYKANGQPVRLAGFPVNLRKLHKQPLYRNGRHNGSVAVRAFDLVLDNEAHRCILKLDRRGKRLLSKLAGDDLVFVTGIRDGDDFNIKNVDASSEYRADAATP